MEREKVVRPQHHKVKFLINKNTIKQFWVNEEERRQVKSGRVSSLVTLLRKGEHFEADLVVNKVNDKLRVIDGNHRIEAILEMLRQNPAFEIEVYLAKYENLSQVQEREIRVEKIRDREREIYHAWNHGTPESTTDYIQQYFKTFPYGEQMLRQLPVLVYKSKTKMSLKMFVGNHIEAKRQCKFAGMWGAGKEKSVEGLRNIVPEDIKMLKAFYADMVEIFGEYYEGHPFYRTSVCSSFYRIWFDNRHIPRQKFLDAFKDIFARRQQDWEVLSKNGGRSAARMFYDIALNRLNEWRKKVQFKTDVMIKASSDDLSSAESFGAEEAEQED